MLHVRCCCQKTLHWSCKYNLLRRSWFIDYLGGGGFKPFSFSPLLGEVIQFDEHIIQMRWNHQLDQSGEGSDDGYPEANSSPLKIDSWKMKFPFQKNNFERLFYFQGGYFKGDGSTQCHGPFPPFNSVNWPWAWRIIPGLTMVDNSPKSGCGSPSKWPFLVGCKRGDPHHIQVLGWSSKWGPLNAHDCTHSRYCWAFWIGTAVFSDERCQCCQRGLAREREPWVFEWWLCRWLKW